MGGQLSFIVLCIANAFCADETLRRGGMETPFYLINGDDHIIPANPVILHHYKIVTDALGFKIN